MAILPLGQPRFSYDDQRNVLIIELQDVAADDIPDPVNFKPSFSYKVEVPLPKPPTKAPKQ